MQARKPRGYWKSLDNVTREVLRFVAEQGVPRTMPGSKELREAGQGSLVIAIHKYHGGFQQVARRLHLTMPRKAKAYWKDFENVKREILTFVAQHGVPDSMPTMVALREAGHASLAAAICEYHGDFHEVAERLGLSSTHKPKGYWKDFGNVRREILAFLVVHGTPSIMPTENELRGAGRNDLSYAIQTYHGGFQRVALQLKLESRQKRTPAGHRIDRPRTRTSPESSSPRPADRR
ncbi:MAG: hypothetical protein JXB62_06995 [Pirellulales bacterium]|nr:hypothetical protein [Pirellulales bacterium]